MTAILLQDTLEVGDNVVSRELEGETVLLNLETGKYFGLDKVGTRIWTLIQQPKALSDVCDELVTVFDVDAETLQADLLRLAGELADHGLARIRPPG